jgi:hypothetical protein
VAVETARRAGARRVEVRLIPTAKNKPCLDFLERSGLETMRDGCFAWDASGSFPLPACIHLDWPRETR